MGDEVANRTKAAFAKAVDDRVKKLDDSIESEKERDAFLLGVPAIVDAIKGGKIKFRVYRMAKFHAKAYITHARMEVIGSAALVGSSNFTFQAIFSQFARFRKCRSGQIHIVTDRSNRSS